MSWYKTAGTDFYISGYNYQDRRETILDLCSYIGSKLYESGVVLKSYGMIEPDGNSYNQPTGVINFYVGNDKDIQKNPTPYVDKIIQILTEAGVKTGPTISNTFKDYDDAHPEWKSDRGDDLDAIRVIRIPVIENNPPKQGYPPEVHWFTGAAKRVVEDIMGLSLDDRLPVWQIANGIDSISDQQIEDVAKQMSQDKEDWFEINENAADLKRRLQELKELAKWASDHHYMNLVASY